MLTWTTENADATHFVIERGDPVLGDWETIATPDGSEREYNDAGLQPQTTYYYRIFEFNGDIETDSSSDDATTLPIPVDEPYIYFIDSQNRYMSPTTRALSVSNWVTTADLPTQSSYFGTSADPDNFRLYVDAIEQGANVEAILEIIRAGQVVQITIHTLSNEGSDLETNFRSLFLRLVTDYADDDASGHGAMSDPENQTILVRLGDIIRVTAVVDSSSSQPTAQLTVGRPTSENNNGIDQSMHDVRELKVRVVVFKNNAGDPSATRQQVETDIADANERFAQSAIRIVPTFEFGGEGDPGVDQPAPLTDGFTPSPRLNPPSDDEVAVAALKDADANTLDVFYVETIPEARGSAYPAVRNLSGDPAYNNWVVVVGSSSGGGDPFNLAHEILHILLNSGHREDPPTALFKAETTESKEVGGTKRIGPYPDATSAGVGEDDTPTARENTEVLP
ncbi:MAG: fibronectin type III domain-containing protein [Verrucomicrobiota bacterium]|nr:fibronectin type III domain-containing protein [Verrucomicrobiota bacterium]